MGTNTIFPTKRGYVLAGTEAVPGTEEVLTVADVRYVEAWSTNYTRDSEQRDGIAPERPGWAPVPTMGHVPFSLRTEIVMRQITGSVGATTALECDPFLQAGGFTRYDDQANAAHYYVLRSDTAASMTCYGYDTNAPHDQQNLHKVVGAVGNPVISYTAGQRIMLGLDGFGVSQGSDLDVIDTGAGPGSVVYPARKPIIAAAGRIQVIDLSNPNTLYGGGSVGSPDNDLLVRSAELKPEMNVVEQEGMSGAQGIARARLNPISPGMSTLLVEETSVIDFNPYKLRDDVTPLEVNLRFVEPGTSGFVNYFLACYYGFITGEPVKSDGNGLRLWSLDIQMGWPIDNSDGSPGVGLAPSQYIVGKAAAGYGWGLDITPTAPLPAGVLVLMAYTV